VNFLCEDMKGESGAEVPWPRNGHTEFGFEVIKKFVTDIEPYGHPDFQPKLVGRSINADDQPAAAATNAPRIRA